MDAGARHHPDRAVLETTVCAFAAVTASRPRLRLLEVAGIVNRVCETASAGI